MGLCESVSLAAGLDRTRFEPVFAWDDRFNKIIGPLPGPWFPLASLSTALFLERLRQGKPAYDVETLDRYVSDELDLIRDTRPSFVVGDTRLSLAVSAQRAGIPFLNVVNAHWSPYASTRWIVPEWVVVDRLGVFLGQTVFDLLRPLFFRAYAKGFNRLRRKWGQTGVDTDLRKTYCAGNRTLYPDLPEIVPTRALPSTHRFLGPVAWSPNVPWPDNMTARSPNKKTVFISLGTSGNRNALPAILEGLGKRPLRVFVATGPDRDIGNPAPGVLELHAAPYIPGDVAAKAADLVIHNGGSGGVNQCLLAGVPFLGVASNLDQFSSMFFAERAGLGKTIRGDRVSPAGIARAAKELLDDPAWKARAVSMRAIAQSYRPSDILMEELDKAGGTSS
jgi:UDP:flavonoid glycosyltransferase YjiC (YdhE family)